MNKDIFVSPLKAPRDKSKWALLREGVPEVRGNGGAGPLPSHCQLNFG